MSTLKRLPIGIQTFRKIIDGNYLYVDKTQHIHRLITSGGGVYFLARPRRFGKSLLISTLEEIFLGNRDLFSGLWLADSDYTWDQYPVIRLDFSAMKPRNPDELIYSFQRRLGQIAETHNITLTAKTYYDQFSELLATLGQHQNVVILVDEYDKPIIDHIDNPVLAAEFREILKGFYTIIKASDQYIRFVLLTGVSKFSKMSVFSGLNNLQDITMAQDYSTLLGITQEELETSFAAHVEKLAQQRQSTIEELLATIRHWYNGYRFSSADARVYNPFSTLLLFEQREFKNYWFESGTPSFLIKLLKTREYNLQDIITKPHSETSFGSYEVETLDPVPLLFQTGYLTITDVQEISTNKYAYHLDFPNEEVRTSFTEHLLDNYSDLGMGASPGYIYELRRALEQQDMEQVFDTLRTFFANIPYTITLKHEKYYQSIFYAIFLLLGISCEAESVTNKGRIDAVVQVGSITYLFEFKLHGTAQEALDQIKRNQYYQKYVLGQIPPAPFEKGGGDAVYPFKKGGGDAVHPFKKGGEDAVHLPDGSAQGRSSSEHGQDSSGQGRGAKQVDEQQKTIYLIGVAFDQEERNIGEWLMETLAS